MPQMNMKKLAVLAFIAVLMGLSNVHMSDTPYGPPMTQFPSGTTVVYLAFDYSDMQNEEITVRVYDQVGSILFEQVEAYTGSGTESIEVSGPGGGAFADGWYVTNLYSDSIVFPIESITWYVGEVSIPTHTPTSTPTVTATPTDTPTPTASPTVYYCSLPLIVKMPPTTPTPTPTFTPTPTSTSAPFLTATPTPTPTEVPVTDVVIANIHYETRDEYITITNQGAASQDMTGSQIQSYENINGGCEPADQWYTFPSGYILDAGASVRIHSGPDASSNPPNDLLWTTKYTWNNDGDKAILYNGADSVIDTYCYKDCCP